MTHPGDDRPGFQQRNSQNSQVLSQIQAGSTQSQQDPNIRFWELDCGLFLTWYLVKYKWRVISPDHTLDLPWMPKNMSSRKNDKNLQGSAIRLTKSPGQAGLRPIYADMILIHWKKSVKPADVIQILKTGWVTKFFKFFNFLTSHSTISWKFLVCASIYGLC